jgi:iron-sulfur cluster assembly protein
MAITMTDSAINRLELLKKKRQTPAAVLRIGVRGGGCSGLSYFMDLVDNPEPKDKIFAFGEGHQVAVDKKSYLFVNGSEIDFQRTMVKTGFVFNNPLASRSCSCGESFTL